MSDPNDYYAGGFRKLFGGVPCKVFSRRTRDGRYINAKDSPYYDAVFDDPRAGISRLAKPEEIAAARAALVSEPVKARRTRAAAPEPALAAPIAVEAPSAVSGDVAAHSSPIWRDAVDAALADMRAEMVALRAAVTAAQRPAAARAVPVAANDARERRSPAAARAVLRAWRIRAEARAARARHASEVAAMVEHREAARREAHEATLVLIAMEAQRDNAQAQVVATDRIAEERLRSISAQDRAVHRLNVALRASEARGDRLSRIAANSRRDGQRAADDLRGARAEARALGKRLDALQDALAASPTAATVLHRHIAAADSVSAATTTMVSGRRTRRAVAA